MLNALKLPSLRDDLTMYRIALNCEVADVPIETLCLPKEINTILRKNNLSRVCDLFGVKPEAINGIGRKRANIIAKALRVFMSYDI